jgi:hypothetical protein
MPNAQAKPPILSRISISLHFDASGQAASLRCQLPWPYPNWNFFRAASSFESYFNTTGGLKFPARHPETH